MAVFSVIALLVALGLAVLLSLQPWETDSVPPQLSVSPEPGVALGDAVDVSPSPQLAVAPATPAAGDIASASISAGTAAGEGESPPAEAGSRVQPAIAVAQIVRTSPPDRPPVGRPQPPRTEPPLEAPASPVPVAVPVAAPAPAAEPAPPSPIPSGGSPGPVTSGGGPVGAPGADAVEVHDGDEGALSFSFYVQATAFRPPAGENLIVQFRSEGSESPSFGLQLWDDGSGAKRGLWASGDAMGGERFLAPVDEGVWHEAVVCFQASNDGDGSYLVLLDGQPIDARAWVSLIDPGGDDTRVEVGLFRDGRPVVGSPDVLFGPIRLGKTLESVLP